MTGSLQLAEARGAPVARATADRHVGFSEIDVEVGDLESAKRHLDTWCSSRSPRGMTGSRYRWFVAMAQVARAEGDLEEGINRLEQAEQLCRPGFFPDVRPIAAMKARIWIARGKLFEAADWAPEAGVSATNDVS